MTLSVRELQQLRAIELDLRQSAPELAALLQREHNATSRVAQTASPRTQPAVRRTSVLAYCLALTIGLVALAIVGA